MQNKILLMIYMIAGELIARLYFEIVSANNETVNFCNQSKRSLAPAVCPTMKISRYSNVQTNRSPHARGAPSAEVARLILLSFRKGLSILD